MHWIFYIPAFWVVFLSVAPLVGYWLEKNRFRGVVRREEEFRGIPVTNWKGYDETREVAESRLVSGAVVLCLNWAQTILAIVMKFFGGEIASFTDLANRARREAMVRMMESFPQADTFVNVRFDTSSVFQGRDGQKQRFLLEIYVTATAIQYKS